MDCLVLSILVQNPCYKAQNQLPNVSVKKLPKAHIKAMKNENMILKS